MLNASCGQTAASRLHQSLGVAITLLSDFRANRQTNQIVGQVSTATTLTGHVETANSQQRVKTGGTGLGALGT
jgi:hypothetical protein